jgi:hypothetical protein
MERNSPTFQHVAEALARARRARLRRDCLAMPARSAIVVVSSVCSISARRSFQWECNGQGAWSSHCANPKMQRPTWLSWLAIKISRT